jgi:putative RNA 2'-phosphotransferase
MNLEQKSKMLSYLLRHKPENANLSIDSQGYVPVDELVLNAKFTINELKQIVAEDSKQRYSFANGFTLIRANQGHTTSKVKMQFNIAFPPLVLYHGTSYKSYNDIMKEGLIPMSRHHVHLSESLDVAKQVATRRFKRPSSNLPSYIILKIDSGQMRADGLKFYKSDNDVWLVDHVPPQYISIHNEF